MITVIRVVVYYLFIVAALRVLGKREFGQLSPLEMVLLLLIPELISQSVLGEDFSMVNGFIALTTLFSLVFLSTAAQYLSKKVSNAVEGKPTVLVHHGQFITDNLNKERIKPEEVFAEMHKSGLERLEQVKWAILETDGKVSFVPYETNQTTQHRKKDEERVG